MACDPETNLLNRPRFYLTTGGRFESVSIISSQGIFQDQLVGVAESWIIWIHTFIVSTHRPGLHLRLKVSLTGISGSLSLGVLLLLSYSTHMYRDCSRPVS